MCVGGGGEEGGAEGEVREKEEAGLVGENRVVWFNQAVYHAHIPVKSIGESVVVQ